MPHDIFCTGNALVDSEFPVTEAFLNDFGLTKGTMHLIDQSRLSQLKSELPSTPLKQQCGGSAANTAYAIQGFGGTAFFAGRVADDSYGRLFNREFQNVGVQTLDPIEDESDVETGQCVVLLTEDAERTLNTCLSTSDLFSADDVPEYVVSQSSHTYIEGYLASSPTGHLAAVRVREIADGSNAKTSITLSDVSMVDGFRENLEKMLGNGVEQLFCNVDEALCWCGTDRVDIAIRELRDIARVPIVTLGAEGCVVGLTRDGVRIRGQKAHAIDENGAGDIFAGAYLASMLQDGDETVAGKFANFPAAKLVEKTGSRIDRLSDYKKNVEIFI